MFEGFRVFRDRVMVIVLGLFVVKMCIVLGFMYDGYWLLF